MRIRNIRRLCFLVALGFGLSTEFGFSQSNAPAGAKAPVVLSGHTDQLSGVAFAPDGKTLATSAWDGTIRIWEASTGKEIRQFPTHKKQAAEGLRYSPDGKVLAAFGRFYWERLEFWDPATGRLKFVFDQDSVVIAIKSNFGVEMDFMPDGKQVVVASLAEDRFDFRDAATGKKGARFGSKECSIRGLLASPDGKLLAVSSLSRWRTELVSLFDVSTGKKIADLPKEGDTDAWNSTLKFSPDGKWLAEFNGKTIRLWDVGARTLAKKFEKKFGFSAMTFRKNGDLIAVQFDYDDDAEAGSGVSLNVWNVQTGKRERKIHSPGLDFSAELSPHACLLATMNIDDHTLQIWDLTRDENGRIER